MKTKVIIPDIGVRKHYFNFGHYVRPDGFCVVESKNVCRHLEFDGKKYSCSDYENRPDLCKDFPWEPGQIADLCGFRFEE